MLRAEQGLDQKFRKTIEEYSLTTKGLSQEDLDTVMAKTNEAGPEMLSIFTL